eukprot:15470728-Alexandrium_andersonii.AAC.1
MVLALSTRYPVFPAEQEGEKATTFMRLLLNMCQNEFESLPSVFVPTREERMTPTLDDPNAERERRKDRILANMKFIGGLFQRQLLAENVIGQVVHDLVGIDERPPEGHMIECACELLRSISHTLDGTPHGRDLKQQFYNRLQVLRRCMGPGGVPYSMHLQRMIQDITGMRG